MVPVNISTNTNNTGENGDSSANGSFSTPSMGYNCSQEVIEHFKQMYQLEQWKEEGFFEDANLLDIACHWMEFEPTRSSVHFLLSTINTIVFLVGFFSDSIVIYVISGSNKLLTPTNILLTNLAISDLTPVLMIPIFLFNSFYQGPAIGKLGFKDKLYTFMFA